jgi:3-hydroxybutyryl-CoA dehydrogenase
VAETLAIAGSGTIAAGLAAVAAANGPVKLWARSDASAERARKSIEKFTSRMEGVEASAVTVVQDLGELVDGATFVVEAIAEEYAAKEPLLEQLASRTGDDVVVATTTSSLSVEKLAAASGSPERFVGLHVFNPVPRMKLVELIYPAAAAQGVRDRAKALCEALEKEPVEIPDVPGFVVNRLLFPYLFSAVRLQDETGLPSESIDTAMKLGAGHPMGPLALIDLVGVDVSVAIGDAIGADVPQRLRDLLAEGKLGRKTGGGLYASY